MSLRSEESKTTWMMRGFFLAQSSSQNEKNLIKKCYVSPQHAKRNFIKVEA